MDTTKRLLFTIISSSIIFFSLLMTSPVIADATTIREVILDSAPIEIQKEGTPHEITFSLQKTIVTSIIMLIVIFIIATEKIHRTMIAFLGATLLILVSETIGHFYPAFEYITLDQAFASIDMNVIALLTGMMIIVGVLSETGVFEWLAAKIFAFSKGRGVPLMFIICIVTGVVSALLDNVTTVILITPVVISIAKIMKMNPLALLIPMILASNVGGAATLIGDPPNILIGGKSGLGFNDFIVNMGPTAAVAMFVLLINMYLVYKKDLQINRTNLTTEIVQLEKKCVIKHKKLLIASMSILSFIVILFFLHGMFHMEPSVPALAGAGILMFIRDRLFIQKKKNPKTGEYEATTKEVELGIIKAFEKDVEWPVLAFFIFLFIIVGALEHSGGLQALAQLIEVSFQDNLLVCALVIMWISAIASAFLDNIPFTVVMLPIVSQLVGVEFASGGDTTILWWALAFGACFGGNGTLIGASANIVTHGIMEKHKIHMSFADFFKVGFPSMIIQMIIATGGIWMMVHMG